jgi:hypothetical protein
MSGGPSELATHGIDTLPHMGSFVHLEELLLNALFRSLSFLYCGNLLLGSITVEPLIHLYTIRY